MQEMKSLIEKADQLTEIGKYDEALQCLREAVSKAPDHFSEHEFALELIASIGDNYFFKGEYDKAARAFEDVMFIRDAPANPYIRLRRGQIQIELGNSEKGITELACAYMNGGKEVFEDEDPKYLSLALNALGENS